MKSENIFIIGFIVTGMLAGAVLGGIYGASDVLLFQQTKSGMFATYEECAKEMCYTDSDGGNCHCEDYKTIAVPLGKRVKEQALHYAFIFAMIGFGPGAIIGNRKWNKRFKKAQK